MNNLKALLKTSNIKQAELAHRIGVSQASVSDMANCKQKMTVENAIAIAEVFGVTVGCVVGTEPIPEKYGVDVKKGISTDREPRPPFTAEQLAYLDQLIERKIAERGSRSEW